MKNCHLQIPLHKKQQLLVLSSASKTGFSVFAIPKLTTASHPITPRILRRPTRT